jgi:hypothetical protein
VLDALPEGAGCGDPREPVKLEYPGTPKRSLLREPVAVPGAIGEVERRAETLVFRLTRALQELSMAHHQLATSAQTLMSFWDGLSRSSGCTCRTSQSCRGVIWWRRHVSEVEPAVIEACRRLRGSWLACCRRVSPTSTGLRSGSDT